jgi:hypothetical protein
MKDLRDDTLRVLRRSYPQSAYLGQGGPVSQKKPWWLLW